jgi:NAD(P)H-flavin reductase
VLDDCEVRWNDPGRPQLANRVFFRGPLGSCFLSKPLVSGLLAASRGVGSVEFWNVFAKVRREPFDVVGKKRAQTSIWMDARP